MNIDRIRLSASIASIVSGVVGILALFGIVIDPDTEAQISAWLFLLTSLFAALIPFLPSIAELLRRARNKA